MIENVDNKLIELEKTFEQTFNSFIANPVINNWDSHYEAGRAYRKVFEEHLDQRFIASDLVICLATLDIYEVIKIDSTNNSSQVLKIENVHKNNQSYKYVSRDGYVNSSDVYPSYVHYRDDYDYSIINFKNLPKRQTNEK